MKNNLLIKWIAAVFAVYSGIAFGQPEPQMGQGAVHEHASDRLFVRFKDNVSKKAMAETLGKVMAAAKRKGTSQRIIEFKSMDRLKVVPVVGGETLEETLERFRNDPNVEYAEPDYIYALSATPNDPSFSSLWALHNTGQSIWSQTGTVDVDINAPEAWEATTGSSSVVIAVLDSGVNHSHPDLNANMWVNPGEVAGDGIDNDGNGYIDDIYGIDAYNNDSDPMDDHSHGSHVAGTIAAVGNNGKGLTGVVQTAKIIGCKIGNSSGQIFTSAAVECLDYIYDLKVNAGVDVVASNNSWGGGSYSTALYEAIDKQRQAGILFLAAAGNDGTNNDASPHYPSNYFLPNVIAVAATDNRDALADFSEYGRRSVHLGAPGVGIYSTVLGTGYQYMQGTSMATPNATGLIALLKADDPTRDWIALKNLAIAGGKPIAALSTNTVSGRRIRAWDTDGTGSMTCSDQQVSATLWPVKGTATAAQAGKLGVAFLNINCAEPAGSVSVSTTGPSVVNDLNLLDDGQGFDKVAGDGIYSAYWPVPGTAGTYTLTFPDNQTVNVTVDQTLSPYRQPQQTTYNYRDISNLSYQSIPSNSYLYYGVPFPIQFAGHSGYTTVYVTGRGTISFQAPSTSGTNVELPTTAFNTLVAPFWDNLNATGGQVRYGYTSTELIIEWLVGHNNSTGDVKFQVVFTKDSSDVLVNYADVDLDNAAYGNGASATIGVQIAKTSGIEFSRNIPSVSSGQAWLWQVDTGAPSANAGVDQSVNGNANVTLSGSGSDPDGGALIYRWDQVAGTAVTINNANSATASFVAPNVDETLSFQLTVTDDAGRVSTDTVSIAVTQAALAQGKVGFTNYGFTASEGGVLATVTVERKGSSQGALSVDYATVAGGTATADADYTAVSGTLNWADGELGSKSFSVPIVDDSIHEAVERISLQLANLTNGATWGISGAALDIVDNDGLIKFSNLAFSAIEGEGTATITVNRSGSSSGAVSVDYATVPGGTAEAGADYTATSGTVSWLDGETGDKTFTVDILADGVYEAMETVILNLSNVSGSAGLGLDQSTLQIKDSDSFVGFTAYSYDLLESVGTVTVTVDRTGSSVGAISVDYATVAGGTASDGIDYTGTSGTLSWADGELGSKTFTVTIHDDSSNESLETVAIQLSNVSAGSSIRLGDSKIRILNDDDTVIRFSAYGFDVNETAGTATVTVERRGLGNGAVSVDYATTLSGTAVAGDDFTSTSGTLNWADGDVANKTFTVAIGNDSAYESAETVTLQLSNVSAGASLGLADSQIRILDDDDTTIQFTGYAVDVDEAAGTATVTVSRTGSGTGAVSVDYATVAGGNATAGSDYTATSGTLSWADAELGNKSFTVSITDDTTTETLEAIYVQLSNVTSGRLGLVDSKVRIWDNDDTTLGFSAYSYVVNEGAGTVTVTVKRGGSGAGAASVDYATVASSTATEGSDFTAASGTLNWANGDTADKTFTVSISDDASLEPTEYFWVQLSNPSAGASLKLSNARIDIADNDSYVTFTAYSTLVYENEGTATITVRRRGGSAGVLTVDYATLGVGTATSGADYTATSGTLSWADGELGDKTFTVPITNDTDVEPAEYGFVSLSNLVGGGTLGIASQRLDIRDDD